MTSTYRGRKIIDTHHALDRLGDDKRFEADANSNRLRQAIDWVIEEGIDEILEKHDDREGIYVIHSKSTGIGVVLSWTRDKFNRNDPRNCAIIVTLLPIQDKHFAKNRTDTMVFTEVIGKPGKVVDLSEATHLFVV